MASGALDTWNGSSAERLDQLLAAHVQVGGSERGRRWATDQLNAAIVSAISGLFQLYCRELYRETVEILLDGVPPSHRAVFRAATTTPRPFGRGNPTAEIIRDNFRRLDIGIWELALQATSMTMSRRHHLERLNIWRNAIAHQDFSFSAETRRSLGSTRPTLRHAKDWRRACTGLATTFDVVVGKHLAQVSGSAPW